MKRILFVDGEPLVLRHPQTVRIILSGHADQELILQCVGTTHQFLAKPCDAEVLDRTVGRGRPTLLLQDQFEILAAELAAAIPEKKSTCKKLLLAADELYWARPQAELCAGPAVGVGTARPHWYFATGDEPSPPRQKTQSVAAQSIEGSDGAVESLRPWLTDTARFPGEWIAAVESTLAQARQPAHRTAHPSTNPPLTLINQ